MNYSLNKAQALKFIAASRTHTSGEILINTINKLINNINIYIVFNIIIDTKQCAYSTVFALNIVNTLKL